MTVEQVVQAVVAIVIGLCIYGAGYYRGGNDARGEPMSGARADEDDDSEASP